jgi:predicted MPP superfamily phosphohydrolase
MQIISSPEDITWAGSPGEPHDFPDRTSNGARIDRMRAWIAHQPFVHRLLDVAIVGVFPGFGAYARFVAPHTVEVTEHDVPIVNLPRRLDGFRIVHLTDLHLGKNVPLEYLEQVMEIANRSRPDIAVLTGDYLQWDMGYIRSLAQILRRIEAPLGVFAVLGNHDYGLNSPGGPRLLDEATGRLVTAMESVGIRVLRNASSTLTFGEDRLHIVGVDDLWSGECDPESAFRGVPDDGAVVFLCHNPDGFGYNRRYRFDLMLSGHTHGAQVRLPVGVQLNVPVRDQRLLAGFYGRRGCWVYVNRGIGYIWKVRWNSAPEVACLTLRRERHPEERPGGFRRFRKYSRPGSGRNGFGARAVESLLGAINSL